MRYNIILIFISLAVCIGCNKKKQDEKAQLPKRFNRSQWAVERDNTYPYRDLMMDDLINNVKLKGLKREEVLHLLGQPNRVDSNYLFYTIDKKYLGNTLFVLKTKTLVVKFGRDSTVEWRKIHG